MRIKTRNTSRFFLVKQGKYTLLSPYYPLFSLSCLRLNFNLEIDLEIDLYNRGDQQCQREYYHNNHRCPGDSVECLCVDVFAHQVFIVYEQ